MMVTEEKIKERIAQLRAARDKFVQDANAEVMAMNVAIKELEKLIEPAPQPDPGKPVE